MYVREIYVCIEPQAWIDIHLSLSNLVLEGGIKTYVLKNKKSYLLKTSVLSHFHSNFLQVKPWTLMQWEYNYKICLKKVDKAFYNNDKK